MKPQPHTWMPYLYRMRGDNDNNKMWIRDDQRIHMTSNGTYYIADSTGMMAGHYNTFEEAEKAFEEVANDENAEVSNQGSFVVEEVLG